MCVCGCVCVCGGRVCVLKPCPSPSFPRSHSTHCLHADGTTARSRAATRRTRCSTPSTMARSSSARARAPLVRCGMNKKINTHTHTHTHTNIHIHTHTHKHTHKHTYIHTHQTLPHFVKRSFFITNLIIFLFVCFRNKKGGFSLSVR